ncbi:Pumilio-like protein [Thalictrum thalictroides]|uniref:Pumilio-like protein n=1 Tax=Thalictrum thalictroides TaxID=46969 RepID=A0A7J6VJW5_THATH|nr:Pumilio-like protein [Thalictrum thalictroides]
MFDDDPSSHHLHHQNYKPVPPVTGFTLQSEGSSSSSLVSGWVSSDDGSPTRRTFEEIKPQTPSRNTHYIDGLRSESKFVNDSPLGRNSVENLMNGMGRLHIGDEIENSLMNRRYLSGIQYGACSPVMTRNSNVERNGCLGLGRVDGSFPMSPTSFGLGRSSALLGLQQNSQRGISLGSCISPGRYNSLLSGHAQCADQNPTTFQQQQTVEETWNNLQLQGNAGLVGNQYGRRNPYTVPSVISPSMGNTMLYQQENPMYGHASLSDLLCSAYLGQQQMPLGMESPMHYSLPTFNGRADGTMIEPIPETRAPLKPASNFEVFDCEDSLIIQGKGLEYVIRKRYDHLKEHRNEIGIAHFNERSPELTDHIFSRGTSAVSYETGSDMKKYSPMSLPLKYSSLLDAQDYIYLLAKDQLGCRFLQQQFEEGSPQDKQIIFQKLIDHVVELMMNPFGNYLVQKLLEKGNAEQRMRILLMVTRRPGELVRISLNMHGTRAVQKLINSLKTQQEKSVVISALEPGFLDLTKDLNGNHVIQHCLQHLQKEENKFIFTAAAKFCLDIATHRHGCCVLQRCIAYATGEDREILVSKVSSNGIRLSQDAFGNYVVQFVLELKVPSVNAALMSQFEGKYVLLSTQKFSSNVVEKCLKIFGEEGYSVIIKEFLLSSQFEKLLQDQYANYVIQTALKVSKGPLFNALVEAIQPYAELLKTNPHCKKIFSWAVLKK